MALTLIAKDVARSEPSFEMVSVIAEKIEDYHAVGLMVPGTGLEPVWLSPRDFKSLVYTNSTIRGVDQSFLSRPLRTVLMNSRAVFQLGPFLS